MKKSYIFITMTAATFLIGCSTVSKTQKASINEQIKKPEIDSSYGDRMKLARKPYSYVAIAVSYTHLTLPTKRIV